MKKRSYFISGHGVWYKYMCSYNQKLPIYLLSGDEDLRLELLDLRSKIFEFLKDLRVCLNEKDVLLKLQHVKEER